MINLQVHQRKVAEQWQSSTIVERARAPLPSYREKNCSNKTWRNAQNSEYCRGGWSKKLGGGRFSFNLPAHQVHFFLREHLVVLKNNFRPEMVYGGGDGLLQPENLNFPRKTKICKPSLSENAMFFISKWVWTFPFFSTATTSHHMVLTQCGEYLMFCRAASPTHPSD